VKKASIIPVAVVALTALAFATVNAYRVPTVEHSFVDARPATVATVEYTVEGLKCRGTSLGFARQIAGVPGIVSLTTYARTRTGVVEYDPTLTDPEAIREAFERPIVQDGKSYDVFRMLSARVID